MNTMNLILSFAVPLVVLVYIGYDLFTSKYLKNPIVEMPSDSKIDKIDSGYVPNKGNRVPQAEICKKVEHIMEYLK